MGSQLGPWPARSSWFQMGSCDLRAGLTQQTQPLLCCPLPSLHSPSLCDCLLALIHQGILQLCGEKVKAQTESRGSEEPVPCALASLVTEGLGSV